MLGLKYWDTGLFSICLESYASNEILREKEEKRHEIRRV